jgi:hypothetical protein
VIGASRWSGRVVVAPGTGERPDAEVLELWRSPFHGLLIRFVCVSRAISIMASA